MNLEQLRERKSHNWWGLQVAFQRNRIAKQGHDYYAIKSAQENLESALKLYRDSAKAWQKALHEKYTRNNNSVQQ